MSLLGVPRIPAPDASVKHTAQRRFVFLLHDHPTHSQFTKPLRREQAGVAGRAQEVAAVAGLHLDTDHLPMIPFVQRNVSVLAQHHAARTRAGQHSEPPGPGFESGLVWRVQKNATGIDHHAEGAAWIDAEARSVQCSTTAKDTTVPLIFFRGRAAARVGTQEIETTARHGASRTSNRSPRESVLC